MLFLQILVLGSLALIFVQDIMHRAVYWGIFPFLAVVFIIIRLAQHQSPVEMTQQVLSNVAFFIVQLLLVTLYFSLKNKKSVNITAELLGWGDVLFLLSIAFYLSVLNFVLFYMASLSASLLGWLAYSTATNNKNNQIPLAGLQAMVFTVFLATVWWLVPVNVTSDDWLLQLLNKWT